MTAEQSIQADGTARSAVIKALLAEHRVRQSMVLSMRWRGSILPCWLTSRVARPRSLRIVPDVPESPREPTAVSLLCEHWIALGEEVKANPLRVRAAKAPPDQDGRDGALL
jgi:hypothetical protein